MVRYHSLEVPQASLPACLRATAWALAPPDEAVMAISHATLPYHGVQFHPESVATRWGPALLRNFLTLAHEFHGAPAHTLPEGLLPQGGPGVPGSVCLLKCVLGLLSCRGALPAPQLE